MMGSAGLAYTDIGTPGHRVLVLGGALGTDTRIWQEMICALSPHLRIVCFDLPGHGRSRVPSESYSLAALQADVLAVLDHLGIRHFSYCGMSLGSCAGLGLAAAAPGRLDRLVLISAAVTMPKGFWDERAAIVLAAGSTEVVADDVLGRWVTPHYAASHPGRYAEFRQMLVSTPPKGYALGCRMTGSIDLAPLLPRIPARTLVISGANDPATPPSGQADIASAMPGARYEIVERAAHLVIAGQATRVAALILDHVTSAAYDRAANH